MPFNYCRTAKVFVRKNCMIFPVIEIKIAYSIMLPHRSVIRVVVREVNYRSGCQWSQITFAIVRETRILYFTTSSAVRRLWDYPISFVFFLLSLVNFMCSAYEVHVNMLEQKFTLVVAEPARYIILFMPNLITFKIW